MFKSREDDFIARLEYASSPTVGHKINGFCGAASPDNLLDKTGIDKIPDYLPGCFKGFGGTGTEKVRCPMNIGIIQSVELLHCLNNGQWFLCGGSIIEIEQGQTVHGA